MRFPHLLSLTLTAPLLTTAHAQTWRDGSVGAQAAGTGTNGAVAHRWSDNDNWSGDPAGTTAGTQPDGASAQAVFNVTGENSDFIIHLNRGDKTLNSLTFNSTGDTTIIRDNNPVTNTSASTLLLGAGGITLASNSGAVTISGTNSGQKVDVDATADMSITNNSSSLLTFNRRWIGQGSTGTSEVSDDGDPTEIITVTVPASLLVNDSLFVRVTAQ